MFFETISAQGYDLEELNNLSPIEREWLKLDQISNLADNFNFKISINNSFLIRMKLDEFQN